MRRLTSIAIVLFAAACQDATTSPIATPTAPSLSANGGGSGPICGPRCGAPILFDRFVNNGLTHWVGKMDSDGGNVTLLHLGSNPSWGPGYKRIAFNSTSGIPGQDIWTMNADGTGAMPITNSGNELWPSWSPDGTRIVFVSMRTGTSQIFTMNADGTNQTQLTNIAGNAFPAWSPDGTRISFTSNRTGNEEVFVMNTDGSNVVQLTNDPALDGEAVWSPDGKRIAYVNWKAGCDVMLMRPDGSQKTPIVNGLADCQAPSFSQDGKRLAFTSAIGANVYAVFTMNLDGSALSQITLGRTMDVLPAWSRK